MFCGRNILLSKCVWAIFPLLDGYILPAIAESDDFLTDFDTWGESCVVCTVQVPIGRYSAIVHLYKVPWPQKEVGRKLLILNLCYIIVSYADILWFCKKLFFIRSLLGEIRLFRLV